ncbi:oxidoreductase [Truncatella angustata]|uniref:Oxidoreductase n=1 Tax=Truncatella angustata TaxID=152316 RepID=A0A9P8UNB5_9PEZI|nr:oxidoreductase [Truncatella angustata]KAH6655352.1 oxidoreductase [Truncatella angustata]KAH8196378.1 hypothetical protein TruAng_009461 [Truncatella angustata]
MPPLRILIIGAGVAGPSLAFWLARCGHRITITERSPNLRASGAQIDLRAQGITVARMMGLMPYIQRHLVDEAGVAYLDSRGRVIGTIMANRSGRGAQSLTSEYEIMRGDLVNVLYDATKNLDGIDYEFGKTVERFVQEGDGVKVWYDDKTTEKFDVLVGADGQGSRTRKSMQKNSNNEDSVRRLGVYLAYWNISRTKTDSNIRQMYIAPSRWIFCRSHSETDTQAYFFFRDDSDEAKSMTRAPEEEQKQFWTKNFQGLGWQTERFIDGMKTTSDFYCQEAAQIKTNTWSQGRVVLLGDAAHCASPLTGMGTTGAFVGAYVLAGEITRHSQNLDLAFANYDRILRPFVDEIQKLKPLQINIGFPTTQLGVSLLHAFVRLICWLRLPYIIARLFSEVKGGWELPVYAELISK